MRSSSGWTCLADYVGGLHSHTLVPLLSLHLSLALSPSRRYGEFHVTSYRSKLDGTEHLALVMGQVQGGENVLVRVHTENVLSDVFASTRDDSCSQLETALEQIAQAGRGVLVYLRGNSAHDAILRTADGASASGRGDEGEKKLFPPFEAPHVAAAHVLRDLGIK